MGIKIESQNEVENHKEKIISNIRNLLTNEQDNHIFITFIKDENMHFFEEDITTTYITELLNNINNDDDKRTELLKILSVFDINNVKKNLDKIKFKKINDDFNEVVNILITKLAETVSF